LRGRTRTRVTVGTRMMMEKGIETTRTIGTVMTRMTGTVMTRMVMTETMVITAAGRRMDTEREAEWETRAGLPMMTGTTGMAARSLR